MKCLEVSEKALRRDGFTSSSGSLSSYSERNVRIASDVLHLFDRKTKPGLRGSNFRPFLETTLFEGASERSAIPLEDQRGRSIIFMEMRIGRSRGDTITVCETGFRIAGRD